jgi:hypothetical protein
MKKPKSMRINPGDYRSIERIYELHGPATYEDFEDHYPKSASGELCEEALPKNLYTGRNVIWHGFEGRMVRVDAEYIEHIRENIFYPDKLAAVVAGVVEHPDKVCFDAPYGTISKVDLQTVKESLGYDDEDPYSTGDEELDDYLKDPELFLEDYGLPEDEEYQEKKQEMDEALAQAVADEDGDLGAWVFSVRDGNHRAFGSLLAGEPHIWAILSDNEVQDLREAQKSGTLTEDQEELLGMLF